MMFLNLQSSTRLLSIAALSHTGRKTYLDPRIDVGKTKYGGPFTTEQVEDVKTVFRMFTLSLSFGFIFTSLYFFQQFVFVGDSNSAFLENQDCQQVMLRSFTYETSLWVVGGIAVYEFAIYPFAMPIIPSSLKRIGATTFFVIVVNGLSLMFTVIDYVYKSALTETDWFWILQSLIVAPLKISLLTSAIEFVCAQSPYNMKGLMIGYMWSEYYISNIIANILAALCAMVTSAWLFTAQWLRFGALQGSQCFVFLPTGTRKE